MGAIVTLLISSGLGGVVIGDLVGLACEHKGLFGFGGNVAKAMIERRKRERLVRDAEKAGISDMLKEAGAKRKRS